ncbi:MAG: 30S ribosomal protein S8e [Candidatus Diapherotrites archaeon]|nr:30S ribosomal protein S8e [Candidatus Diapherotrites archaeon]
MTQWHLGSKRKSSGGIRGSVNKRDKRLAERGGDFSATGILDSGDKERRKPARTKGGQTKVKAQKVKFASVTNQKTKKTIKAEIISVAENNANRQFTRQNIITKNAVIRVKIEGKEAQARVTSRPGQTGSVQAVLLE